MKSPRFFGLLLSSLLVLILILLVGNRWGMNSSTPAEVGNHSGSARVIDAKELEIPALTENDVPAVTPPTPLAEQVERLCARTQAGLCF
jgi:hypothetical protein